MMRNGNVGKLRGGGGAQRQRLMMRSTSSPPPRWVRFQTRCCSDFSDYALLGLNPFASKSDVKHAYKRLALKYHPDVIKEENIAEKNQTFKDIKSAYESLMHKFEEEELNATGDGNFDESDEWEEWMGFEGGIPAVYNPY